MSISTSLTRRRLIQGAGAVAAAAAFPHTAFADTDTGSLSVATNDGYSIPANYMGLSYEKRDTITGLFSGSANASIMRNLFTSLGGGILRIGANSTDFYTWLNQEMPNGEPSGDYSMTDVDNLLAFFEGVTGAWSVLYALNLAGAVSQTGKGDAQKAVLPTNDYDELTYAVSKLIGSGYNYLYGVELGNEPDFWKNSYFSPTWALSDHTSRWMTYFGTTYTPGSFLWTGPATGDATSDPASWTVGFMNDLTVQAKVSVATQHFYRTESNPTVPLLLTPDTRLANCLSQLQPILTMANNTKHFRLSECNSFLGANQNGTQGVSDTLAQALWGLDFCFLTALSGNKGVNFHGGGNATYYSPIYDYGSDNGGPNRGKVESVQPLFYGMKFFQLATYTGNSDLSILRAVTLSGFSVPSATAPTAYACKTESGIKVVIINRLPSTALTFTTINPGVTGVTKISMLELSATGANGLYSTIGININGAVYDANGNLPTLTYTFPTQSGNNASNVVVPAASAILLHFTATL